ncbi:mannosyltransferase family protein [Streptomyces sp. NPDC060334]|uniref:mannosyltransferase family protein n=1 Tax=unclassified Streptomyces TaxID=2593676 RepID=UPI00225004D7|nr:mannosyltransferase family protein [Streptomyces sp. NBC_00424]MCX5077546.1 mannosyltransferase family protein [Streptomyces sp. NBC_00424]WUD39479.1 mannosyltransferase family protein [Streptomyces sp. NBC_00513]
MSVSTPSRPVTVHAPPFRAEPRPKPRRPRFGPADREVLSLYVLTRIGIWITAGAVSWLFPADGKSRRAPSLLSPWQQWDWWHYLHIAQDGYFPDGAGPWTVGWDNREAFFPGFPLTLRAVHVVVPHWAAAGALISFVAGGVAVLALARIARRQLRDLEGGRRAAVFFLLSPCAVFLAAGYTESLFLALALPAWLAAQRGNWPAAAALTCLACSVRVTGLFLAAALVLHFVLTVRDRSAWRSAPWLALPALTPVLYGWFLSARTGDWMAWKHAQERGWYRDFHAPWDAWSNTWEAAFHHTQPTGYALMSQAELLAILAGVVLLALLVRRRRLPEALYLALTLWALGTSYWYTSIPRSTLLWWPLWIALAGWSLRRPRVQAVYLYVVAPLGVVVAITFLTGRWAG